MQKIHNFTREQKLKWFGEGEWCDEPDEVEFEWADMECYIRRVHAFENSCRAYGGHLCGYVKIPEYHPLYDFEDDLDSLLDVHGGITYTGSIHDDKCTWIGFDCSHYMDVIPSMIIFRRDMNVLFKDTYPNFEDLQTWESSYKNINFCIEECKKLAEQLALIKV